MPEVWERAKRWIGQITEAGLMLVALGIVLRVAREMGLARFGKLSVDGTKVRANASKRKAMSYERIGGGSLAGADRPLTKAGAVDAEEDDWGEDFRGDELPQELQRREKRLAAMAAICDHGREPGQDRNPRGGRPSTASPSRRRRAISPESQIEDHRRDSSSAWRSITRSRLMGPQASDQGQLVGLLDGINETFGVNLRWYWPMRAIAEPDLLELENRGKRRAGA